MEESKHQEGGRHLRWREHLEPQLGAAGMPGSQWHSSVRGAGEVGSVHIKKHLEYQAKELTVS